VSSVPMTTVPGPTLNGRGTLQAVAIVTLAMALHAWSLPWLTRAWSWALQTGVGALNLNALVSLQPMHLPWGLPAVSRLSLVGPAAATGLWGGVAQMAVLLAVALAVRRWRRQVGPWAPIIQTVLALSGLSVLLFGWGASSMPQHLAQHTGDLFVFGVVLQCLVPLVLGLTFFPLEGRWHLRLAAVALTLGYFMLCLPIKLLAHAWLIGHVGAAIMPLLFLCFGPVLDVLLFVAIYAWMASWRPAQA
jgi:hypothetical protein